MNNWEQTAAALDHLGTINYIKQLRIENNCPPGIGKKFMGNLSLERIRQKAEEYEKRREETSQFQEQIEEVLLERIRQKAEEHEDMRQRDLEWQDNIQAIRETYRLSDAEMKTIIREVEQEESDPPVEPQPEFVESSLFDQLTSLFFSPRGRIGRGVFALSLIATVIFLGMVVSISSLGFLPIGLLSLVATYSQFILSIKRFHDMGKSGWLTLLYFIPLLNIFVFLYLLLFQGSEGPNRFDEEED